MHGFEQPIISKPTIGYNQNGDIMKRVSDFRDHFNSLLKLRACKKITLHSWVSMRALMCNLILVVPCASQELIAPSPHQKLIHL